MKILVTGGAGFIGSNVVDKYIALGHDVFIVDNLSSGKKENINPKARFYKVDIRDKNLDEVFDEVKPDVVNHHAAQIDVRVSVENPKLDADINTMGLLNVLENCRRVGVKKIIYVSSGGVVYGNNQNFPLKETEEMDPVSPYGITKATGEFYLRFYSEVYGIRFTALRYSNVYGPRQDPHGEAGVIAIFSNLMLEGKSPTIFGDGEQKRDFVFIGDVVEANVIALDSGDGESFNIGTGVPTSVNELFHTLALVLQFEDKPKYDKARPGELELNYLDVSKARKIGWNPNHDLSMGLKKTIDWVKRSSL